MQKRKILSAILIAVFCIAIGIGFSWVSGRAVNHALTAGMLRSATEISESMTTLPQDVPANQSPESTKANTDTELLTELRKLIDLNLRCLALFESQALSVDDAPEKNKSIDNAYYSPVISEEYESMEDIETLLSQVYVKKEVSCLLYGPYDLTRPSLYKEIDGELYRYNNFTPNAGQLYWGNYSINILYRTQDTCRFQVNLLKWDQGTNNYETYTPTLVAEKEKDGWKLLQLYSGISEDHLKRIQAQQIYAQQ